MEDAGPMAHFVFKLRRNIALEGDLLLARLELKALLGVPVEPVADLGECRDLLHQFSWLSGVAALDAFTRPTGQQGFSARAPVSRLVDLVRRLAFVQQMYVVADDLPEPQAVLSELPHDLAATTRWEPSDGKLCIYGVPHNALIELTEVAARRSAGWQAVPADLDGLLDALLDRTEARTAIRLTERCFSAQRTTSHLSHDLHYYKAKFFPRMARALINVAAPDAHMAERRVLDPFAGSGTTLLEASLMGMLSTGVDVDPLSVLIARSKLDALDLSPMTVAGQRERLAATLANRNEILNSSRMLRFPAWLLKNRKMTSELAAALRQEIGRASFAVARSKPESADLVRVLLSDAVARRIRLRFLGTGVGRFALTLSTRSVPEMLLDSIERYSRVAAVSRWLQERIGLRPAHGEVRFGDARELVPVLGDGQFDAIVTSPPYLPASSGRESYARARAMSLIALGVLHETDDVDSLADSAIGSMNGGQIPTEALTGPERALVDWLQADPLRRPKAAPTARYFLDMGAAFHQMRHALAPGALALVVSGKQSTYYRFADREPLYVVPAAEMLAERARMAGFEVEALHNVQLQKTNRNARPRSLDDYYETVIALRAP